MAILQLILSLITRSAGRILNAIFGWAVRALFGRTSPREQTVLSALVGAAAAWPLFVLGALAPRISTLALAFVPLPRSIPKWTVRIVWLSLAALLPIAIGLVVAAKAPPGATRESFARRVLRGFPITLGLAGAFLVMFVTLPVLRVVSLARKRRDQNVPLVTTAATYHSVAELCAAVLNRHGFELERARPAWWAAAPSRILLRLGGSAFRRYVPVELAYFRGAAGLELALYPSGLLLRGAEEQIGAAHALVVEALTRSEAFQTTDVEAQRLETRIKRLWETGALARRSLRRVAGPVPPGAPARARAHRRAAAPRSRGRAHARRAGAARRAAARGLERDRAEHPARERRLRRRVVVEKSAGARV